jgi:2-polyprenyl-3-methyl-5-hydroxy-6-metoxy-1,4-benzoquinol methylase
MKILYNFERDEVTPQLPNEYSRVLDIGCSDGRFAKNLLPNCEYWGIEPYCIACEEASKVAFRVLNGTFDEKYDELPDNYFDLVICNDVIEHMGNHYEFLRKVKLKMTVESHIVGSIPNVRYIGNLYNLLILKDWRYIELGVLDKTHLRFFTKKSIVEMFAEMDYIVESIDGINRVEFNFFSAKSMIKNSIALIMGKDTLFMQFTFRVRFK